MAVHNRNVTISIHVRIILYIYFLSLQKGVNTVITVI